MINNPNTPIHSTPLPAKEGQEGGASFLASLIFFTRLPWWRLCSVPKEAFEHVVDWWPFIGWLTGGVMAGVYVLAVQLGFPIIVAVLLAIGARLMLTGALHEDGLADFCDGFGGGTTRARTLEIMKDSHIGTYGILGLIFYFGLLGASILGLSACPLTDRAWSVASIILLFDVAAKVAASFITGQLPYARTVEGAKNQVVYAGRSLRSWIWHCVRCSLALAMPILFCCYLGLIWVFALLPLTFVVEFLLMFWMYRRLGGYTGDCCGALFLLCELSLYLVLPLFI